MSAVMISAVASPPPALPRCGRPACPPVGMLADGTPFYAPIGAAGRERARTGELTRDAATAARGRRHPEQRRRKTRRAIAAVQVAAVAQANTERARARLARVAADVARR